MDPVDVIVTQAEILTNLDALFIVADEQGLIRYVSNSLQQRTGCDERNCVGKPLASTPLWRCSSADREQLRRCIADAIGGKTTQIELDLVTPNGCISTVFSFKPIRRGDGICAVLAQGTDLTAQRLAEKALRDSQFRWKTIADCTVDWEFWIHPAGHFLYSSPSCQRITGFGVDEIIKGGQTIVKLVAPQDRERVGDLLTTAFSGSTGHSQRFQIVRKDGTKRSVSMSWQPVQGDDGKFLGVRGSIRDESNVAIAESKMQQLVDAYRILTRHFPEGLVGLLDHHLRFLVCDGSAFESLQIDPDTIVGKCCEDVVTPSLWVRVEPLFARALEGMNVTETIHHNGKTWLLQLTSTSNSHTGVRHIIASATLAETRPQLSTLPSVPATAM